MTDGIGPYQPQVPGAEFGFGVRWRLALKLSIEEENVGRLGAFASQVCVPSLYVCVFATRMQRLDSLDCCRITHSCTHTSDVQGSRISHNVRFIYMMRRKEECIYFRVLGLKKKDFRVTVSRKP